MNWCESICDPLSSDPGATHVFLFRWPGSEGKNAWSWRSHHQRTFSETARRAHLAKTHGLLVGSAREMSCRWFCWVLQIKNWRHKKKHHKEKQREQSPIAAYSSSCPQAYWLYWELFWIFWHFVKPILAPSSTWPPRCVCACWVAAPMARPGAGPMPRSKDSNNNGP